MICTRTRLNEKSVDRKKNVLTAMFFPESSQNEEFLSMTSQTSSLQRLVKTGVVISEKMDQNIKFYLNYQDDGEEMTDAVMGVAHMAVLVR
jgi:hypothetical protein